MGPPSAAALSGHASSFDSLAFARSLDELQNRLLDLGRLEGLGLDLGEGAGVDEEVGPHELGQLAEVELGHEHPAVAAQYLAQVRQERVEVYEVGLRHLLAPCPCALDAGGDGAVGRAPT